MKKFFLSMVVPLVCMATLSAQISQKEADNIVRQRLENETKSWSVYTKEDVQTEFGVTTSTGELLELDYPAWVYFVSYAGETVGKYLIVKENNGNLLEINTKNDAGPNDLTEWRAVAFEIPFTEYSLEKTLCLWTNLLHPFNPNLIIINSNEELEQYISCATGNCLEIDFSKHTLLLVSGINERAVGNINKNLQQLSENEYKLNVELDSYVKDWSSFVECWHFAIVTSKLSVESTVALNVTYKWIQCKFKKTTNNELILINSNEELEHYIECTDNHDFPEIDFSNHTLLLANGMTTCGINNINAQFTKTDENVYNLDVDILLNIAAECPCWIVKTLIAKLPSDVVVMLNVDAHH